MDNPKLNILFLIPSLRGGGSERIAVTLLKHLDRRKFNLAIGVVNLTKARYQEEIPSDVDLINIKSKRVRYALPKLIRLIWKLRPDVVVSSLGHLNLSLAILRPCLPKEVRLIARESSIVSSSIQSYKWPFMWMMLYQLFYNRHDLLVCQSKSMQLDLVEKLGFPSQKSIVINNPVDVEFVRELSGRSQKFPERYDDKILLVAAGRMEKVKGFDILIEALHLLDNPQVHLVILGEGPLRKNLEQMSILRGLSNQVEFVGFKSNPYAWFARADAFVMSSRHEGFPNVVLEALACGTPVIATPAVGGVREILDRFPNCVLAEEINSKSLANAISLWLSGDRRRVDFEKISPFSIGKILRQYEDALASFRNLEK